VLTFRSQKSLLPDLSLYHIIFSNNKITAGDVLGEIVTLTKACRVDISGNQLGPTGMQSFIGALGKKCRIEELDIGSNGIGDTGLGYIVNGLSGLPQTSGFHISHNNITSASGDVLSTFISSHPTLKALDISDNNVRHEEDT